MNRDTLCISPFELCLQDTHIRAKLLGDIMQCELKCPDANTIYFASVLTINRWLIDILVDLIGRQVDY